MAGGWAQDGAEQEQAQASVEDALTQIRDRLHSGESAAECTECGEEIPKARRRALPGVQLCVACQEKADAREHVFTGYNRRGSKHSQMR